MTLSEQNFFFHEEKKIEGEWAHKPSIQYDPSDKFLSKFLFILMQSIL